MSEKEEMSFGERETLRSGRGGEAGPEGTQSFGDRETLRDGEGWGILEEWGGKRWKAGEVILGRYVVERELGQGGMGVVYECLDKVGGVRVAVKALPPELSHNSVEMEEVRENFQLVVGLRHSNIAGVRTLEEDGRGEYFLVMDVAEGVNLRKWLREKWKAGGMSLKEATDVLRQVAVALDYAHEEKVVHRDVKPGNVMIDGRGRVKVLDFGLAAQIRTSLSRASRAYWGTSGTGPYMAPEQWEAQPQDAKTDQYALAVMAYEMLAGRLPFETSELAVLKDAVLHGAARAIPGLPKAAMRALRKGMAKDPPKRFGSCGEFVAALAGGSGRRSARGKTLMGCAVVLALLGAVVWQWHARMDEKSREVDVSRTEEEARRAEAQRLEEEARRLEERQQEAERQMTAKKAEGERLAAEKAAEEEARRLEEERGKAEREKIVRQESEELEETVYQLAPLAKTKAENAWERGYDRGQGFGAKLDEMKAKLQQGEAAMGGRNFKKAKTWFEESMAAAGWLEENAPLREAAGRAKGAAEEAKKKAEAMAGARLGLTSWQEGEKAWEKAETAWEKAEFLAATAGWNEAGAAYRESEKAARAEKVKQGLESAQGAKKRGAWEAVIVAAKEVLEMDGGNAEAKALKAEAEGHRKPSIRLTATLNGREVAATVTEGLAQSGAMTPVTVKLKSGGRYEFAVEYQTKGKKYAGRTTVQAKAKGVTDAVVALAERKEVAAGDVFSLDLGGGVNLEMVYCPGVAGDFWIGKTEVTQEQWQSVMGQNPSHFAGKPKNPVETVSRNDCKEFVKTVNALPAARASGLSFRLPTEEEWETACRAGAPKSEDYCKLMDGTQITEATLWKVARYGKERNDGPVSVASFLPNAWGLYDMHGNVWEWTQTAGGVIRVNRGGCFFNTVWHCTADIRDWLNPLLARRGLGLRLAASGTVATR